MLLDLNYITIRRDMLISGLSEHCVKWERSPNSVKLIPKKEYINKFKVHVAKI